MPNAIDESVMADNSTLDAKTRQREVRAQNRREILRLKMKERRISPSALAESIGITPHTLLRFLKGEKDSIGIAIYEDIADFLDIPIWELLTDERPEPALNKDMLRQLIIRALQQFKESDIAPEIAADMLLQTYDQYVDRADEVFENIERIESEKVFSMEDVVKMIAQSKKTAS